MDLFDDETYTGELMDRCVDVALDFGRAQIGAGADTIGIGDAAASQISRGIYEELILPRQQRLVRGLKEAGAKVRMHICGNITHLLPGLASLELDIIDVDHMVDLRAVRRNSAPARPSPATSIRSPACCAPHPMPSAKPCATATCRPATPSWSPPAAKSPAARRTPTCAPCANRCLMLVSDESHPHPGAHALHRTCPGSFPANSPCP
jgi:hypothetical protein